MRALALVLLLAGCVSTPNLPPLQYYVLGQDTASARRVSQRDAVLLVHPTSVSAFYDTQRLVFSRASGQRAYYQFAAWTERPGRSLSELLIRRLDAASTTAGIKGDLVLHTRLEELYHDASRTPGRVNIALSAELVDGAGRLVQRARFARAVPVSEENAAGAVAAANRAVSELLEELAAWIDGRSQPQRVSGRSP